MIQQWKLVLSTKLIGVTIDRLPSAGADRDCREILTNKRQPNQLLVNSEQILVIALTSIERSLRQVIPFWILRLGIFDGEPTPTRGGSLQISQAAINDRLINQLTSEPSSKSDR